MTAVLETAHNSGTAAFVADTATLFVTAVLETAHNSGEPVGDGVEDFGGVTAVLETAHNSGLWAAAQSDQAVSVTAVLETAHNSGESVVQDELSGLFGDRRLGDGAVIPGPGRRRGGTRRVPG